MEKRQLTSFRAGLSMLFLLGIGAVTAVASGCTSATPTPAAATGLQDPGMPQVAGLQQTDLDASTRAESDAHRHFDEARDAEARGDRLDAVTHYGQSISADASYLAAYEGRAAAYHALGDEDSAVRDYDRVLEARPSAVTYTDRGHALITAGRYAEAELDNHEALTLATNSNEHRFAYVGLGDAHRGLGEYEEAVRNYTAAIMLNSDDWNALYGRGSVLLAVGEYQRALEDFDQVVSLRPHDAAAYYARGFLRWLGNQCAAARDDFRLFLVLKSDDQKTSRAREYLERIGTSMNCEPPEEAESLPHLLHPASNT